MCSMSSLRATAYLNCVRRSVLMDSQESVMDNMSDENITTISNVYVTNSVTGNRISLSGLEQQLLGLLLAKELSLKSVELWLPHLMESFSQPSILHISLEIRGISAR